jgi:Uma2 family endonuclease
MSATLEPTPTVRRRSPAVPDVPIYRLTVQQYQAMSDAGILTEDDSVELLEGWLVAKMSKSPPHVVSRGLMLDLFPQILPAGWFLSVQGPIAALDSLPEPDLALIRRTPRDYLDRRPAGEQIALVVEVADTSLEQDRGTKKRIYAEAGIVIYRIVNLIDRHVEVYTDPTGPADQPDYRQRRDYGPAEEIPVQLDGAEVGRIPIHELLP